MPNSKLTLAFNTNDKLFKTITFKVRDESGFQVGGNNALTFLPFTRTNSGQISLVGNNAEPGNAPAQAQLYAFYLDLDYNQANRFTILRSGGSVEIELNTSGHTFYDVFTNNIADITIDNEDITSITDNLLEIDSVGYSSVGGLECNNMNIILNTKQSFDEFRINNVDQNNISDKTVETVSMLRGEDYYFLFGKDSSSGRIYLRYPEQGSVNIPILSADNFTLITSALGNSGTLTIQVDLASILNYQYSIDGGNNYQSSSTFENLPLGDYTLRILDLVSGVQTGCTIDIPFTISDTLEKTPFAYISRANSILFKKSEDTEIINQTNSFKALSRDIWYCNEALLNREDETEIQIKTSYDNVTVSIRDENGSSYNVPVVKNSSNLNIFSELDGVINVYNETQSVVYFNYGNVYDENGSVIDLHSLKGSLPEYAKEGQKIFVQGIGIFEVQEIIYLDSLNRNCMVINHALSSSGPLAKKIKSVYNLLEYEVYSFNISWIAYPEGYYDITVGLTDDEFDDDLLFVSENINLKEEHDETIGITYYNSNNKDVFYFYGIKHFARFNLMSLQKVIRDEIEINVTDQSVDTVSSKLNEGELFIFSGLTRENLIKLAIALSCENIYIENLKYTKAEPFELEPVEGTNLQNMSATMLLDTENQNDISNIEVGVSGEDLGDIPGIITESSNFITY